MSDTFTDNQEVTAQDLNNIAIDLGYADYASFPESAQPSAVSALNQITADLVTAGVLHTLNECAVTIASGKIYVNTGVIVFADGAKKRIEAVQSFDYIAGTTVYVYALHDTVNNSISLVCDSAVSTATDYVSLATVADGVVTMTRKFAQSKVTLTANQNYKRIEALTVDYPRSGTDIKYSDTIDVGFSNFNYVIFGSKTSSNGGFVHRSIDCSTEGNHGIIIRSGNTIKFVNDYYNHYLYLSNIFIV